VIVAFSLISFLMVRALLVKNYQIKLPKKFGAYILLVLYV